MGFSLVPDLKLNKYSDLTAEYLVSFGIRALILDIDNTLEPYENPVPSPAVINWLDSLKAAGVMCGFVSNNGRERIEVFNKSLGLPAIHKAKKPFKKNILGMLSRLGVDPSEAAIMGDQIFTDVWAGRNAGIKTIIVPPINDKRDLFTKFKRLLEKGIIKKYDKRMKS